MRVVWGNRRDCPILSVRQSIVRLVSKGLQMLGQLRLRRESVDWKRRNFPTSDKVLSSHFL